MDLEYTEYFMNVVLEKRPYIKLQWIAAVLEQPLLRQVQSDGRIRHWRFIPELERYLRVVTLEDGRTVHNAFPDRDFREET